jgi:hypothetical protein
MNSENSESTNIGQEGSVSIAGSETGQQDSTAATSPPGSNEHTVASYPVLEPGSPEYEEKIRHRAAAQELRAEEARLTGNDDAAWVHRQLAYGERQRLSRMRSQYPRQR